MSGSMSSLNNHTTAGGPHYQIQVRPVLGCRQSGQHPIHRGQIVSVEILFRGPSAEGPQDGTPRFHH